MAAELAHPVLAPGQVVRLVARGVEQAGPDFRVPGGQGLAVVQGLGRDFARVVYAHQACRMAPGGLLIDGFGRVSGRIGPGGHVRGGYRAQSPVDFPDQAVGEAEAAGGRVRACTYYMCRPGLAGRERAGREKGPSGGFALGPPVQ